MKEYVDMKLSLDDLNFLRNLAEADKKNMQIDIIDTFYKMYELINESVQYSNIMKSTYKFCVNTGKNLVKSVAVTVGGFFTIFNLLDKDPEFLYSLINCTSISTIGFFLFQDDNKKENFVSLDVLEDAVSKYRNIMDQLKENGVSYYRIAEKYFDGRDDFVVKDEMERIFESNKDYINEKKALSQFRDDFSFDSMYRIGKLYFDDNTMRDMFLAFESERKQKQRKL